MIEIPLRNDLANFEFTIDLEDSTYRFSFLWNERTQLWSFSISEIDGTPIICGIPVFVEYQVLQRFKDIRLPPGFISFYDTSGKHLNPGRDDLGDRVKMIYILSDEEVT